jgi:hypothetical protein
MTNGGAQWHRRFAFIKAETFMNKANSAICDVGIASVSERYPGGANSAAPDVLTHRSGAQVDRAIVTF